MLVAVNSGIDEPGFVGEVFEDGTDGNIGFFGYHGDVFAVSNGFHAVFRACTRNACGFDYDVERQVHHLHGVGEYDVFALFYGFGSLFGGVASDRFVGVETRAIISVLGCVWICIADDGYVELIDDARLCDEGCGVMPGAYDANAYGAVNLGEELVIDHGDFPRVMELRLREPVRRRLQGFLAEVIGNGHGEVDDGHVYMFPRASSKAMICNAASCGVLSTVCMTSSGFSGGS